MRRYAAYALFASNLIPLLVGKIIESTIGDEGEEAHFAWFSPRRTPKGCPRGKYRRRGWSTDFKRDEETGRLHAVKDKERVASACIAFPSLLKGSKPPQCVWDTVSEQVPPPRDEDVNYDDDKGYEDGEEGSDNDPSIDIQQPYVAPGYDAVGVGGEPNLEGGDKGIRTGFQGVPVGSDAPP